MKSAAVAADCLRLAGVCVAAPVSSGGGMPQILAFRAFPAPFPMLPIALATLSLGPRLVLFAGGAALAAWWAAFLTVVAGMDPRLRRSELPPGAGPQTREAVFLDPDFIGVGGGVVESLAAPSGPVAAPARRPRHRRVRGERSRRARRPGGAPAPSTATPRLRSRAKVFGLATPLDAETAARVEGPRPVEAGAAVRGRRRTVDLRTLDE